MKLAMTRLWVLALLLSAPVLGAACGPERSAKDESPADNAHAAEEATEDEPPAPPPPAEEPLTAEEVPVAEDFAQEAEMRINTTNYRKELEALGKEITQDPS